MCNEEKKNVYRNEAMQKEEIHTFSSFFMVGVSVIFHKTLCSFKYILCYAYSFRSGKQCGI